MQREKINSAVKNYVTHKHPEVLSTVLELMQQQRLTDLSLIKPIYDSMYNVSDNPREELHFFVAVIIETYYPEKFSIGTKMPAGIRSVIAKAMGFASPEMVNFHMNYLQAYMKHPRFVKRVKDTAEAIINEYSTISKVD